MSAGSRRPRLGAPLAAWIAEGNPARVRKAADIPDEILLDAVRAARRLRAGTSLGATRWDVGAILDGHADYVVEVARRLREHGHPDPPPMPEPTIPPKVILAKAKRLISLGRMEGCACGCRGDWEALPTRGFDVEDDMTRGVRFTLNAPRPPATPADYERIRTLFSRRAS